MLNSFRLSLAIMIGVALNSLTPAVTAFAQQAERSSAQSASRYSSRRIVKCEGWTLHISEALYEEDSQLLDRALQLLEKQLQEIVRVVPKPAVEELKKVPLWLSAEYPGTPPRAEYHPDAGWLKKNNRDPAMEKGIEFTNVRIFEEETRRMPNFALHELAHAYHDRVLPDGFANPRIRQAYDKAKTSGTYDTVEQRFGNGRTETTRAYAMSTPQEYFAECSEAFFSTNDFFPFNLKQLSSHDPEFTALLAELWGTAENATPPFPELLKDWKNSGSLWINTTSSGVTLDADTEVLEFPLCIRLFSDQFPFAECQPDGKDLRIYSPSARSLLAYEIDTWDPLGGNAVLWVRVPAIRSNERQELQLYWGNPNAESDATGNRVFNASNGYITVWHFGEELVDSTGLLQAKDIGTTSTEGPLGRARSFSLGHGIHAGTTIADLPTAAAPHSTEAWINVERPNATILAWGNEKAQGKIVMQYRSPSRINMDCYFSGANITTDRIVPLRNWKHIVHTYSPEATRIYVDGKLADEHLDRKPVLALESPARFYIGGWYDRYEYEGAIDEVRISSLERDANWIRLQYENQKPHSLLVGNVVIPGDRLTVSPERLELDEGTIGTVEAIAQGAEKLSWELHRDGGYHTILTDRLICSIPTGRVEKDESFVLVLKAVYPTGIRSIEVPITVRNSLPDPVLAGIRGPSDWNGRTELILQPELLNAKALANAGSTDLHYEWTTSGVAIARRTEGEKLILTRAQGNGVLQVHLKVHNGGTSAESTASIRIQQPPRDQERWIERPVAPTERPRDGQFIPRDGWGDSKDRTGTLVYSGSLTDESTLTWKPEKLIVRAFAGSRKISEHIAAPKLDGTYSLSLKLPATLQTYRCELLAANGSEEKLLHEASNLLCGDVYLIIGQSNAVATDFGKGNDPATSKWVRTFGSTSSDRNAARRELWGDAHARADGGELMIGYWGLELGKALVDKEQLPVCLLNGAVGGTRIDQHQRNNENPTDPETIYGRLLWRARQAGITHGVRGIFWHQGENDQGADGPTNRFGYETYEAYFVDLAASWKEDYPNTEHYFAFQIWPKACAMGFDGSDNRLRDVQRRLPRLFSTLTVVSTLGIKPPGGCHYPAEGYAEFARFMLPLVEQKIYGSNLEGNANSPNLLEARWKNPDRKTLELIFDTPMSWNERCVDQFFVGNQRLEIESGFAEMDRVTLQLKSPFAAAKGQSPWLTYVDSQSWNQDRLLYGANGLAALTFCDVPIRE